MVEYPDTILVAGLDHASDRWHLVSRDTGEFRDKPRSADHHRYPKGTKIGPDERRVTLANTLEEALKRLEAARHVGLNGMPYAACHVFAEESLALANGKTTRILGLAAGAMWDRHVKLDMYWHWVPVSSWQSWAGIKQNLKTPERKAESRAYSLAHGGSEDWEEDHYDADVMCMYGIAQLEKAGVS